jgi:hypothetical protein
MGISSKYLKSIKLDRNSDTINQQKREKAAGFEKKRLLKAKPDLPAKVVPFKCKEFG